MFERSQFQNNARHGSVFISLALSVSLPFGVVAESKHAPASVNSVSLSGNNSKQRTLATLANSEVGLTVSRAGQVDQVWIDTGVAKPTFEVKRLNNPPRLVVDLPSQSIKKAKNMAIADLDFVSTIRVGGTADSGRVVFDLTEGEKIEHLVDLQNGKIFVQLSNSKISAPESNNKVADTKVAEPRLPEIDSKDKPLDNASARPALPVVPVVANSAPEVVQIKSVRLTPVGNDSGIVAIDVANIPEFTIEKTAPSEYVLTLKNAKLPESALSSTLFSPSQNSSIRSVRSNVRGSDALIRIFANPETYLTARSVGSQIVVEETQDLRKVVDDMRAQMAPVGKKDSQPFPKMDLSPLKDLVGDQLGKALSGRTDKKEIRQSKEEILSPDELTALRVESTRYTGKLISLDLQDTDIDNALRIIAEVSNLNIVASEEVVGKVTLRLTDVPWDQALDVILRSNGLDSVQEGNVVRIAPIDKLRVEREAMKQARVAESELEELAVKYIRVSYGRAADLKGLVETVLSERGTVAYDERSNQLIVKDIRSGIDNVSELISKVDLRTPQILLETQIIEASSQLTRQLGTELGFQYIQSPTTGNGTGLNFPSAISLGGSLGTGMAASAFPVAATKDGGSAISMLFESADGTKALETRLSQLETEGRVRIVSRPAVATTNNKPAEIKSVEKYRVRLPSGGTSVATGQGSVANGTGGVATEVIEAGIVLNVTPQASPDYFILLDIKAKSSSFGLLSVEGIPNEIERSASSSVLVSSGQTFALGGIYKLRDSDDVAGIPFLKDIPVLGTFFRRLQTQNNDEELLFFITPRIVEGSFDDSSMKKVS